MKELRTLFVQQARQPGTNFRALCQTYGISRTTGYKWLHRNDPHDRSRRPHHSPRKTPEPIEQALCALRAEHPYWGPRKLRQRLADLGHHPLPAVSTIAAILQRHGFLNDARRTRRDWQRFVAPFPNALWQMDFKGHFALAQGRCHPLTVLDDCTRYALCVHACTHEDTPTVQRCLERVFRDYGLPDRLLCDHGAPWGAGGGYFWTPLTVWLCRLGIEVLHGRPAHPQTQGKCERFHRTLKEEVLQGRLWADLAACQQAFDHFRVRYNHARPHEALQMQTPASVYQRSGRCFPAVLPEPDYPAGSSVRRVQAGGVVHFGGRLLKVPKAFRGQVVGVEFVGEGVVEVCYFRTVIATMDLSEVGSDV